jgi:uncharacterized protein YdbL (DUF1318 family)
MRIALLALLCAGCVSVTINVSFPQEKIDSAASSIVDMVRSPSESPKDDPGPAAPAPQGLAPSPRSAWLAWFRPSAAEAQQRVPELKTRTPEVMAAIESMRRRFPELDAAARKGCVGENNQGLAEARPGPGCPGHAGQLVAAENGDRMFLYRTLVEQNQMPAADITKVQAGFARSYREKASRGTWVQQENGEWLRK